MSYKYYMINKTLWDFLDSSIFLKDYLECLEDSWKFLGKVCEIFLSALPLDRGPMPTNARISCRRELSTLFTACAALSYVCQKRFGFFRTFKVTEKRKHCILATMKRFVSPASRKHCYLTILENKCAVLWRMFSMKRDWLNHVSLPVPFFHA